MAIESHGPSTRYITATAGSDPTINAAAMSRNFLQSVFFRTAHALLTALMMDKPLTIVMTATGPKKIDMKGQPTKPTPIQVIHMKNATMWTVARMMMDS